MESSKCIKLLKADFSPHLAKIEDITGQAFTPQFASLVSAICQKIGQLANIEVHVDGNNLDNWKLQLASFLMELQCPHDSLSLESLQDRMNLLHYLTGEYLVAKKCTNLHTCPANSYVLGIMKSLNIQSCPDSPNKIFDQILATVQSSKYVAHKPYFSELTFTPQQWSELEKISKELNAEFSLRRSMLNTRFSATMDSFLWSDRAKKNQDVIANFVSEFAKKNLVKPMPIGVSDLLAARQDILEIRQVSSTPPDTRSANPLTKIKVGRVPDRGGRPSEQAAPPPEMPSWQPRSGPPHGSFAPRGGGGHSRGGGNGKRRDRGVQGAGWK